MIPQPLILVMSLQNDNVPNVWTDTPRKASDSHMAAKQLIFLLITGYLGSLNNPTKA